MENAKYILQNNASWTSNCDSKVSYMLTVNGVILTIILTSENSKFLYNTLRYVPTTKLSDFVNIVNFIEFVALLCFLGFLLVSFFFAFTALKARVDPNDFSEDKDLNDSIIFWGAISKKTPADYKSAFYTINDELLKADLINQVYVTSKICKIKFDKYNKSLKFTAIAYITLIIFVVIKIKNPNIL